MGFHSRHWPFRRRDIGQKNAHQQGQNGCFISGKKSTGLLSRKRECHLSGVDNNKPPVTVYEEDIARERTQIWNMESS
jgi:hypothetical protein